MPYIKQERRNFITTAENEGELNYLITKLCHNYIKRKGLTYGNINAVIGALECCKLEVYRRVAINYEDSKIAENGDVAEWS